MLDLKKMPCEACRGDAERLSDAEAAELQAQIPGWQLIVRDGIRQLERDFSFDDFAKALAFTGRVGCLAERQGHHPSILTEWGHVRVRWYTHKINGLHRNDFIMAARTDELAESGHQ